MSVPGAQHGRLIGKGGAIKARLLAESGCSWANPINNSDQWEIRGLNAAFVNRFVDLAAEEVPGCAAQVTVRELAVRDLSGGPDGPGVDWRTHRFRHS